MTTVMSKARAALQAARRVAVLTGAGISAESGVPTFRGEGGLWRNHSAMELATPAAWARDPVLVWEFYDHRRRALVDKAPNAGHRALAAFEGRLAGKRRGFTLITQNVDGLHEAAGSRAIVRLHGSIWRVRCSRCGREERDHATPVTPGFAGPGPGPADLPRCACGGVTRPAVVWFGESLRDEDLEAASRAAAEADVLLVVGTSAVVYPAAGLVPHAKRAGAVVIEVNLEPTAARAHVDHHLTGPSGALLPELLHA